MKKETFIKKVQKELDNIKEKATPEELKKLKFPHFDKNHKGNCIYGLMTDSSNSLRAHEIQKKEFIYIYKW